MMLNSQAQLMAACEASMLHSPAPPAQCYPLHSLRGHAHNLLGYAAAGCLYLQV